MSHQAIIPIRSFTILLSMLALALLAGCASGGTTGATGAGAEEPAPSGSPTASLTQAELDKLDAELRDRLEAGRDGRFPVRVSFANTPSTDELLELMLTRYDRRYGVGRVDRATLEKIASSDNVRQVSFVDGLSSPDAEPRGEAMDGG